VAEKPWRLKTSVLGGGKFIGYPFIFLAKKFVIFCNGQQKLEQHVK